MVKKAGRPAEFGERKSPVSFTITPTLKRFLMSVPTTASHHVEKTIRNTIAFIEWEKNQMKSTQNPLLFEKNDPTVPLEDIKAPTIKKTIRSTHKRDIRDLRRKQTAETAVAGFSKEIEIYGFTKGQFSVIDLLESMFKITGPAALTVSTWTAAKTDITTVLDFVEAGHCTTARWLVDFTFQHRSPELAARIREVAGHDAIRLGKNHAKFFMMRNAEWNVICLTSMNLNFNPRFENFMLRDDKEMCDFHDAILDEIWTKQKPSLATAKPGECERFFASEM